MSTVLPTMFFPASIFGAIIISSTIKLSTESTFSNTTMHSFVDVNTTKIKTTTTVSEEERLQYLDELQTETTITMIPAMVFLLLLAIIGLIGNSLVMFVYSRKFKHSATRIIIITIAVFDLVANVLAIPGDIYDMFHIWDFDNPTFCRARLFFSSFTTISSALALLAVAVVRYRKICTPTRWQISIGKAKIICIVVTILGFLFSTPYAIINGRQTKLTPRPDIFGHECTTDDSYVPTKWPLLNYGFFLLLYIGCSVSLTVLYILIGVQAWKHSTRSRNSPSSVSTTVTGSNLSSEIIQPKQSQTYSNTSNSIQMEQIDSSDNLGITSISNENIAEINFGEIVEHIDQYTVCISNDRVVIRTPMMGEIVVNLQKAASDQAGASDNCDNTEDRLEIPVENINDSDQERGHHFVTDVQVNEHRMHDLNKTAHDIVGCTDVCMNDGRVSLNSTNAVFKTGDNCHTDHRATVKKICIPISPNEQRIEKANHVLNDHIEQRADNKNCVSSFRTEQKTEQPSFTTNAEIVVQLNGNLDIGLKTPTPTSCKNPWEEMTSDKHSLHSLGSDFSQASCDFDPVAALKWVDIVYCHEGNQIAANLDTPKAGNDLSCRISPNNNLLQRADWLRNIIAEALTKSLSRSKKFEEVNEFNKDENMELKIIENENVIHTEESSCNNPPCVDSSQSHSTQTMKNRLKETIIKKSSILKRRISKRQTISRTTAMLIIISAIYILGYLPHLGLMFFKFTSSEKYASMSTVELTVYNLFLRTFFLNCAANPVVYSFCDRNFRRECIGLCSCFSRS